MPQPANEPPLSIRYKAPEVILDDRTCVKCGYNLRGLKISGRCPECGRLIQGKKRAPRYTDQLVHAPMVWLEVFATGALVLFLSATAFMVLLVALLFVRGSAMLLILGGVTLAWSFGVFLATRPRPPLPATDIDTQREWRGLRLAARVTQVFWPLTLGLGLFCNWVYNNSLSTGALYAAISCAGVSLLIAVGGLAPLCVYLSHMADWAEDSSLADSFRGCAWTIGFCGLIIGLSVLNGYTGILGGIIGGVLATLLIAIVYMPPGYFLYCLFRLQSMARWAVWNHIAAEAKLDRFKARAQHAARKAAEAPTRFQPPPAER